jgi:hypothetical protein
MRTKIAVAVPLLLSLSAVAFGQTQVQCRPLQPNDFLGPDESIVGSGGNAMVCHSVVVAKVQPAPSPRADATPASPAPAAAIGGSIGRRAIAPSLQVAVGYQYDSVNFSDSAYGYSSSRINTNGVFTQVIGNVSRYVSVVGNVDAIYKNVPLTVSDFSKPVIVNNQTIGYGTKTMPGHDYLLTYTGGVQAYPLSHRDLAPFVRGTFGAGTLRLVVPVQYCGVACYVTSLPFTTTGFAWQIGGGLDYRLKREGRLSLRIGQFDYSQLRKNGVSINSLKIGAGLTF